VSERSPELDAKWAELAEAVRQIDRRLSALERARLAPQPTATNRPGAPKARPPAADASSDAALGKALSLSGRTFLVLAGAFVLRALTDAGTVPAWLGVLLGFAYAGTWLAMAERSGRAGEPWSALAHGLATIVIGFPLLFEATWRFRLVSPAAAAAVLTALTAVALGMAAHRRLHALAWLVSMGGLLTAVALMPVTGRLAPFTLYLVLLGVATLWLGYVREWFYLRWPVALVTDLVVMILALRAVAPATVEGPRTGLLVLLVLMGLYLGSIAIRTLLLSRSAVVFEVVQTALAMLVGLGGASVVAGRSGIGGTAFGAFGVVFGVAAYAVAFAFVERRKGGRINFYLYTSVAIALVLAGTAFLLSGGALPVAWAGLAVLSGWLARRHGRFTLAAHGVAYAVGAAVASGLLAQSVETMVAPASAPWPPFHPAAVAVLAALAMGTWLASGRGATALERAPRSVLLAALTVSSCGVAMSWLVPALAGAPGPGAHAGAVATARTAVMVGGALLLAWVGRHEAWSEAGWLAYPVLVAIGLKVLLEDLPQSPPATLFLTFALYGGALILVPRLRRRAPRAVPAAEPATGP
jgi:hypothetical protein